MTGPLIEERHDGVLLLSLNRERRRNALSAELVDALLLALHGAQGDGNVRAVVLTGAGDTFCAGGDLGGAGLVGDGLLAGHDARGRYGDLLVALDASRVPVVAAVNGDALGGGFGLAAACHLIVADERANFACPELSLGLFPMMIAPVLLRNLPQKVAMDLILTGRRLSALEAVGLGLVKQVAPSGTSVAVALALGAELAGRSRAVMGLGLRAIATVHDQPLAQAIEHMKSQLSMNLLTEDAAEGIAAFVARRQPVWRDR
jgi:enoyl-CoA hydratase